MIKPYALFRPSALVVGALSLFASAQAVELPLHLVGSTTGSFTFTPVPGVGSGNPGGLSFLGGAFDTYTAYDPISNAFAYSLGSVDLTDNSLGVFRLTNATGTYNGSFKLDVSFSAPTGISPTASPAFTAALSGTISTLGGKVLIDFDNTPQTFTFAGPDGPGSFNLLIQDINIGRPRTGFSEVAVSGEGVGSVQAVPSPGSLATFAFGLVYKASRRRRRNA